MRVRRTNWFYDWIEISLIQSVLRIFGPGRILLRILSIFYFVEFLKVEEILNPGDSDKGYSSSKYAKRKFFAEGSKPGQRKRKYKKHQKINLDGPILDEETGQILGDENDQDDSNYRIEVSYYKGKNGKTYGPYKTKVRRQTVRKLIHQKKF